MTITDQLTDKIYSYVKLNGGVKPNRIYLSYSSYCQLQQEAHQEGGYRHDPTNQRTFMGISITIREERDLTVARI